MHELPATKWQLHRDGDVIETPRGRLWPVRLPDGTPAMLKWFREPLAPTVTLSPLLEQCRSLARARHPRGRASGPV